MEARSKRWTWWLLGYAAVALAVVYCYRDVRRAQGDRRQAEEAHRQRLEFDARFATVELKMTRPEVEAILGPPDKREGERLEWFRGEGKFDVYIDKRTGLIASKGSGFHTRAVRPSLWEKLTRSFTQR